MGQRNVRSRTGAAALALVLSLALVAGTPLDAARAYAAEPLPAATAESEGASQPDTNANGAGESAKDPAGDGGSSSGQLSEDVPLDAPAGAPQDGSQAPAGADAAPSAPIDRSPASGQATAAVPLVPEAPKAVVGEVVQDGLVYRILDDGESVALVGWRGASLAGDVAVPYLVMSGEDAYAVTVIGDPDIDYTVADGSASGVLAGSGATSLSLPASVETVADGALSGCSSLESVFASPQNQKYASSDGMLFSKDLSALLFVPEGKRGTARIPDETSSAPASAFSSVSGLSAVHAGEGSAAFSAREGVLYSKDGASLLYFPAAAGNAVVLPAETESIGEGAFAQAEGLASIVALGYVRDIHETAFAEAAKRDAQVALPAGEDYDARKVVWEATGFQSFVEPAAPGDAVGPTDPEGQPASGFVFTLLDDYTLSVGWAGEADPEADLVIPVAAKLNDVEYRVSAIAAGGFQGRQSLSSVPSRAPITGSGDDAFAGCTGLASVELAEGVSAIGAGAFSGTAVQSVVIPASVSSVGSRAFADCPNLSQIITFSNALSVAGDAMSGCAGVSVYAPYNETGEYPWYVGIVASGNSIQPYGVSFSSDPLVIEVDETADLFEGGVRDVPDGCELTYSYAAKPLSVDQAGIVTGKMAGASEVTVSLMMGDIVLTRASRLLEVSQPRIASESQMGSKKTVATINQTLSLESGVVTAAADATGTQFSVNGLKYQIIEDGASDTTRRVQLYGPQSSGGTGSLIIPSTVTYGGKTYRITEVRDYAFSDETANKNYTGNLVIPQYVTKIGNYAFKGLKGMTGTLTLPSNLSHIGSFAFQQCKFTGNITMPKSLTEGSRAFYMCAGFTSVTIPDGATTIPDATFDGCTGLRGTLSIPSSVKSIGQFAFEGCAGLSGTLTIPSGVTSIASYAFEKCTGIEAVSIPSTVKRIEDGTFNSCTKLSKVSLPSGLEYIGKYAFGSNAALKSIEIPSTVSEIGKSAFYQSGLTSVRFSNTNLLTIGGEAFYVSSGQMTDIYAHGKVQLLDTYNFLGATNGTIHLSTGTIGGSSFTDRYNVWYNYGFRHFDPDYRTITFDSQGGSTAPPQQKVEPTAKISEPSAPTKSGYSFGGWYTSASGGSAWNFSTAPSASMTLYARWNANYSIIFNGNGNTGGSMSNQSMTYGTAKNLTSNGFTKTGHTFAGWAESATGAVKYANGASAKDLTSTPNGTVTLYAKWTPITYQVTFNANNGDGTMQAQTITYGTSTPLSHFTFTRLGYTFAGWAESATATKAQYTDQQSVLNLRDTQGATVALYAVWEPNSYQVVFHANYPGNANTTTQDFKYNETNRKLNMNPFTRTGWTFEKWTTNEDGSGTSYANQAAVTTPLATQGSYHLYAQWTRNNYDVTFNSNGGSYVDSQSVGYGNPIPEPQAPKLEGYTFDGWYADAAFGGSPWNFTTGIMPEGGLTLYAKWTANTFTVTLHPGTGAGVQKDYPFTYAGRNQNLPAFDTLQFSKTGYVFKGWTQNQNGSGTVYADKADVATGLSTGTPVMLYAQWEAISYSVVFDGKDADAGTMQAQNLTFDHQLTPLSPNEFSKTGYAFAGWDTDPAGATVVYKDQAEVRNLRDTAGQVKLYAVWDPIAYTLSFDSQGGSQVAPQQVDFGALATAVENPKYEGYTFHGWYTEKDGAGTKWDFTSSTMPAADTTLYAKWALVIDASVPVEVGFDLKTTGALEEVAASIESRTVEDLAMTSLSTEEEAGAVAVFPKDEERKQVAVMLTLTGAATKSVFSMPLGGELVTGQLEGFVIPAKSSLRVTYGLSIPKGATITANEQAADKGLAKLKYVVGRVPQTS